MRIFSFLTLTLVLLNVFTASAQKNRQHDTSYFSTFPQSITPRLYSINKYASINFPSSDNTKNLQYRANTKLNVGLGLTYNNLSLNGAIGFGFLNNSYNEKGSTKPFDFQFHIFPDKWVVDVFVTFYKGVYAYPKGFGVNDINSYYYRNDIKFDVIGASAYYMPNWKRFSYRAAFLQNEWQKKSAGTLLYGGQVYYNVLSGDSNLVPSKLAGSFSQSGIDKFNFITFGPGVGYAYTLVAAKHFFVTGSLVANLDVNFATEHQSSSTNNKTSFEPSAVYKVAAGYNGSVWSVTADWMGNAYLVKGSTTSQNVYLPVGAFRVIMAKKITLNKPIRFIDKIIKPDQQ